MSDTDDMWRTIRDLRQRLVLLERAVGSLQKQTSDALQAERELAETLADNAGWD